MIRAPFSGQVFDDQAYGLPSIRLENWYVEEAPDRADRSARLIPTPGWEAFARAQEARPVYGMTLSENVNGGALLVHVDRFLYRYRQNGSEIGKTEMLSGKQLTRFEIAQAQTVASTGRQAFIIGDDSVTEVTLPEGQGRITDCCEINQRYLYLEENSGRVWYSDPADAVTIAGFLTGEAESDNNVAIRAFGGSVYVYGTRSIEVLRPSSNNDVPFYPSPGGTIQKGVLGRAAATAADFGQFFVGSDHLVYRLEGYNATRISTHWIERQIQDLSLEDKAKVSLTAHAWEGHTFLTLSLPNKADYVYDAATQRWHRRKGNASETDNARVYQEAWGKVFVGNDVGGTFTLKRAAPDQDGDFVQRVASTLVPVEDGYQTVQNIIIETEAGLGVDTLEQDQIMLRIARDGQNFGNWQQGTVGAPGERRARTIFGPFGQVDAPYFAVEIAYSGPYARSLTALKMNVSNP